MGAKKIRLGILFGGKSAEHEISLLSAKNIVAHLDLDKYEIILIGIDKKGQWHLRDRANFLLHSDSASKIQLHDAGHSVALVPQADRKELMSYSGKELQEALCLDVIFPVLHGTHGEDGTMQGLLKLANIPFVGAGVLGSAVGMDKDVMKRLLRDAKIPVAHFLTVHPYNQEQFPFETVVDKVGLPFFVKPANAGSSVGIAKVKTKEAFTAALKDAFQYDRKVLLEEYIQGREIECCVLGNDHPLVSLPAEIIPHHEFYSYEAKYLDAQGATYHIPAQISSEAVIKMQSLAIETYRALCCEGTARVDFFLKEDGTFVVNEINTLPGFRELSVYPKLWEASGIPCTALLDSLIALAFERHAKESALKTIL
jgi:D-alanine-D-alanine ligase